MIDAIKKRRSVRQYLDEDIPEEILDEILLSVMYVPSANAIYPWDLVVVKDAQTKEALAKTTPWSSHISGAEVVIAVVGHEKESADWVEDCSIVAEHIWLAATEQGLSSCWTHIRGNDNAEKEVKKLLNIPDDYRVLCLMPLGKPAQEPDEHTKDAFDKSKIKYEKYK